MPAWLPRPLLLLVLVAFVAIRMVYERGWRRDEREGRHDRREHLLTVGVALSQAVPALVWISSDVLAAADLPLPASLRWLGALLSVAGIGLFVWIHATLGANFSPRLDMRADHTLVTAGPYHFVRHPMYTTNVLLILGYALLSANAVLLLVPGLMITVLLVVRLPDEEAMMRDRFGEEWRRWAAGTGRLLPRLRPPASSGPHAS